MKSLVILKADKLGSLGWKRIKKLYPRKYAQLQQDIKACGKDRARILFTSNFNPMQLMVSYA